MNKHPYFAHRNDAHEDEWHQELIRKFGMEGYGRWWIITELFDRNGRGDQWETSLPFLREKLHARTSEIRKIMDYSQTSSRLLYREVGEKVVICLPKFRKIQANLKSKSHPIAIQKPSKNSESILPPPPLLSLPSSSSVPPPSSISINTSYPDHPLSLPSEAREPLRPENGNPAEALFGSNGFHKKYDKMFEIFWNAYPIKAGKGAALEKFKRLGIGKHLGVILTAIRVQKKSKRWKEGYIPNPATWLNQRRWEDEVETQAQTKNPDLYV